MTRDERINDFTTYSANLYIGHSAQAGDTLEESYKRDGFRNGAEYAMKECVINLMYLIRCGDITKATTNGCAMQILKNHLKDAVLHK